MTEAVTRASWILPAGVACALSLTSVSGGQTSAAVNLSPAAWEAGEVDRFMALETSHGREKPLASGTSGLICGSSSALAVRAGLEALQQGGSAADAVLTGALAQIVMNAGATVSCAGILEMVYYDAATGSVYALDAGFNTVRDEDDPLSIPAASSMTPGREAAPAPGGARSWCPGS